MMVALDLDARRDCAALRSRARARPRSRPGRAPRPGRSSRRRGAPLLTPEVTAAWLLAGLTALVFALLLGLKDDPAAHAAAVDRALAQAEQAGHDVAPTCRLEDEWRAPCW